MQGSFFIPTETFLSGLFLKKNGPISASLNGPVKNNKQGGYVVTLKIMLQRSNANAAF
jgi:hypothetical protein